MEQATHGLIHEGDYDDDNFLIWTIYTYCQCLQFPSVLGKNVCSDSDLTDSDRERYHEHTHRCTSCIYGSMKKYKYKKHYTKVQYSHRVWDTHEIS
jgi:hypothetical protein